MKILVSGRNSQIGQEFFKLTKRSSDSYIFTDSTSMNFLRTNTLEQIVLENKPDVIVNFAAYTKVDDCETNKDESYKINADAPGLLAALALKIDAMLIHISTDYVFGDGIGPFHVDSKKIPANFYGLSKLAGENAILKSGCQSIIIRTSSVFSPFGNNFVKTIMKKLSNDSSVRVIEDQMISLTNASDIAISIKRLISLKKDSPLSISSFPLIFHYTNIGYTTWYDLASFIRSELNNNVDSLGILKPIKASEWDSSATRAKDTRLVIDYGLLKSLDIKLYNWQDRVANVLELLLKSGKKND